MRRKKVFIICLFLLGAAVVSLGYFWISGTFTARDFLVLEMRSGNDLGDAFASEKMRGLALGEAHLRGLGYNGVPRLKVVAAETDQELTETLASSVAGAAVGCLLPEGDGKTGDVGLVLPAGLKCISAYTHARGNSPAVAELLPGEERVGRFLAEFAQKTSRNQRIAILGGNAADPALARVFKAASLAGHMKLLELESAPDSAAWSADLEKLYAFAPDTIFLPTYVGETLDWLIPLSRSGKLDAAILGLDSWDNESFRALTKNMELRLWSLRYLDAESEGYREFARVYEEAYRASPTVVAALSYFAYLRFFGVNVECGACEGKLSMIRINTGGKPAELGVVQ